MTADAPIRVENWTPTQEDFDRFARLSGDDNPIHVDPAFSARTRFGRTVAHGMLLYTRVWAAIRRAFPGQAHLAQTQMFPNPSFAGEELRIEIRRSGEDEISVGVIRPDGLIGLSGTCRLGLPLSRSSPPKRGPSPPVSGVPAFAGKNGGGKVIVGQSASISRTFTPDDAAAFAALAGLAERPQAVPEPLIGALFSYLLGVEVPGPGTNYLKQETEFLAPAGWREEFTAEVAITRLRPDKALADLATLCRTGNGTEICRGRALVLVKDVGRNP